MHHMNGAFYLKPDFPKEFPFILGHGHPENSNLRTYRVVVYNAVSLHIQYFVGSDGLGNSVYLNVGPEAHHLDHLRRVGYVESINSQFEQKMTRKVYSTVLDALLREDDSRPKFPQIVFQHKVSNSRLVWCRDNTFVWEQQRKNSLQEIYWESMSLQAESYTHTCWMRELIMNLVKDQMVKQNHR